MHSEFEDYDFKITATFPGGQRDNDIICGHLSHESRLAGLPLATRVSSLKV